MGKKHKRTVLEIIVISIAIGDFCGTLFGMIIDNNYAEIVIGMAQPMTITISILSIPLLLIISREKYKKERIFSLIAAALSIGLLVVYATFATAIMSDINIKIIDGFVRMSYSDNIFSIIAVGIIFSLIAALIGIIYYITRTYPESGIHMPSG